MNDSRAYDGGVQECAVCHANVLELRRGRCWGCYARWTESRPVGVGARCVTCGEQRQRLLRSVELYGGWQPMCFNCGGQLGALRPMPRTLAALREALSRDRRKRDRRIGKADTRVYPYERRVGERRTDGRLELIDDDMIVEITVEPATGDGDDFDGLTQIRELVRELRDANLASAG
jgi:hypothetical protein